MKKITDMNISDISSGIQKNQFSATECLEAFLEKARADNNNTFITKTFDLAMSKANEIDHMKQEEKLKYKLIGVPFALKDTFCTKDIRSTCGSKMLENFIPDYESTISQRLLNEKAIIIGKANQDEFCMGSSGDTSAFGPCINPIRDKDRPEVNYSPGGSSSGPAAAVANNYCPFSIGTDTGGSIKEPASFCDIYGFRPTYGTFSRYGMISYSSSLDQGGIFAKNAEDIATIYDIIKGPDGKDASMSNQDLPSILSQINNFTPSDLTIAIPTGDFFENLPAFTKNAWEDAIKKLASAGCKVIECKLPHAEYSIEAYAIITMCEAFSNLSRFDGIKFGYKDTQRKNLQEMYLENRSKFGSEVKRRIMLGNLALSAELYEKSYLKACKIRRLIHDDYQNAFKHCDLILTPTVADSPFELGQQLSQIDMWLIDFLTLPSNLAGLGGMSVPFARKPSGMPIGMQLVANKFQDLKIFQGSKILSTNI